MGLSVLFHWSKRNGGVLERLMLVVSTAAIGSIALWALAQEQQEWSRFAQQNDCTVVEHIRAKNSPVYVFGGGGRLAIVTEPGRQVFECKGGVRYTR